MAPPNKKVVDSWALAAWIRKGAAAPLVRHLIEQAEAGLIELLMSRINVAETFCTLAKRDGINVAEEFLLRLPSLPIRVVTPDEEAIMAAARIKATHAVAFGDAFAIALARSEGAMVITGDEEIRKCRAVRVEWLGPRRQ